MSAAMGFFPRDSRTSSKQPYWRSTVVAFVSASCTNVIYHVFQSNASLTIDDLRFYVLLIASQSYQANRTVIMKGFVNWNSVYGRKGFSLQQVSNARLWNYLNDVFSRGFLKYYSIHKINDNYVFRWKNYEGLIICKRASLFSAINGSGLQTIHLNFNVSFINPIALRKAKIAYNFGLSECNRVNDVVSVEQLDTSRELVTIKSNTN